MISRKQPKHYNQRDIFGEEAHLFFAIFLQQRETSKRGKGEGKTTIIPTEL